MKQAADMRSSVESTPPLGASSDPFILGQLARVEENQTTCVLVLATDGETRGRVHQRLEEEFEVVMTRSLDEACERLRRQRFALALLDYREPGQSPDELARELRLHDAEMSVIALGAGKAVRVMGEHSLQVPFDLPELITLTHHEVEMAMRRRGRTAVVREMEGIIALLQREVEAKETLAAHGEASASMVHDLKNALVSTLGYTARLIQETAQLKNTVGEHAKPIDAIAKKLEHTSNYLLHLSQTCRLNEGAPVREILNLREEIDHVHAVLFFHSPYLLINGAEADSQLLGDRYELHRVFQNLFKNAFEAGAREVRVTVSTEAGKVIAEVADNGSGFATEDTPLALNRPLRSSKRGGQGLGLRICRQIIERHGGVLSLRSSPGAGAVFTITLPAAPSPANQEPRSSGCFPAEISQR